MGQDSIFTMIVEFFRELVKSLGDGYLFFGGPLDIIRYVLDIAFVTFLFYWMMLFLRQTRAWQLVKGIVLILVFVALCSILGFQMVGFLFNRLLYVIAFFFIILFQPEFRRVLENLGLRSSGSIKEFFGNNNNKDEDKIIASLVHEICYACKEMCKTYTGALILIERNTKLDELLNQENVVRFDSTVTNSVLQSIFYKGSPMHDGGLLIRDGRIVAARCHVPLSVTMHSLERSGTRHRAAVGASEMGDTIAVVVSEERGKCSIAVNGMLFEMADEKELEANLSYLLGIGEYEHEKKGIVKVISKFRKHRNIKVRQAPANVGPVAAISEDDTVPASSDHVTSVSESLKESKHETVTESQGAEPVRISLKTRIAEETFNSQKISALERFVFILLAFLFSLGLWMYIQVNNNPVVTKTITVPISYSSVDTPENIDVSYPIDSVDLKIVGRQNTIANLTPSDIVVSIDYSSVTGDMTGVVELPVTVKPKDNRVYFRIEQQLPETVSVTVYSVS
ncbi:TIGR00159 family protein [Ruminococcaceae bacterium YRB3002]|nr:TIGR00159 family protein [Ruminococcaceae bacterium YRB3002]